MAQHAKVIAYIPARGGSKRVPQKNIRLLGGKPVLTHVLDALRSLEFLEGIGVSTDDEEIARVAQHHGATVLALRDRRLANDRASFVDLLKFDVPRYLAHFGVPENEARVLFGVATAALVTPEVYRQAYQAFVRRRAAILIPTVSTPISPFWALVEKKKNVWKPLFPRCLEMRSQELPRTQVEAGLFYFLNYDPMARRKGHWFTVNKGLACFPVPRWMAVDVDTMDDWAELEKRYQEAEGAVR